MGEAMTPAMNHPRRRRDRLAGVYVHVPFCARLCPYCDFAVTIQADIPHDAYAEALLRELEARGEELDGRDVRTLYFGGGTPSLWRIDALARVIDAIAARFGICSEAEITLEANPNQVTEQNLADWAAAGINRLSIGCQSFQPRMLHALRRNHDAAQAEQAVRLALEAMPRVSLDLIYGGPEQTMTEWEADLSMVASFEGLSHLSAYHLTIEPGTAFDIRLRRGSLVVADEDLATDMMDRLVEAMKDLGLEHYEVSNFARPSGRSRHNNSYWVGAEYLGLGVGAHSLRLDEGHGVVRRANVRKLKDYLSAPLVPAEVEQLDGRTHFAERLFLGMRTVVGVELDELEHQFDAALVEEGTAVLDGLIREQLIEADERRRWYGPGERGLRFADSVAERIFAALLP
jgi:oxygen-independent coproporphyrinogen III oxidase